jgi:hypothetical protein
MVHWCWLVVAFIGGGVILFVPIAAFFGWAAEGGVKEQSRRGEIVDKL